MVFYLGGLVTFVSVNMSQLVIPKYVKVKS